MFQMLSAVWALLLGIVFIMLGNGMHFTLMGLRGGIEGFSATELAVVTSGYFMGFLSGARYTPLLIRRVGHVRVFAALGSFISAGLISFPLLTEPWAWTLLRLLVGFCMSGILKRQARTPLAAVAPMASGHPLVNCRGRRFVTSTIMNESCSECRSL